MENQHVSARLNFTCHNGEDMAANLKKDCQFYLTHKREQLLLDKSIVVPTLVVNEICNFVKIECDLLWVKKSVEIIFDRLGER